MAGLIVFGTGVGLIAHGWIFLGVVLILISVSE